MYRAAKGLGFIAVTGLAVAFLPRIAKSADPPNTTLAPAADLSDLYVFSDSTDHDRVVFALTVHPNATPGALFSEHVQYVIHTTASATFGAHDTPKNLICTFQGAAAPQLTTCWFGAELVARGDANTEAGIASTDGKMKVFAGRRRNPLFFNRDGFDNMIAAYNAIQPPPEMTAGCGPVGSLLKAGELATILRTPNPGNPANSYEGSNVLALVVSLDRTLFAPSTTPYVSAWASTNEAK